jgi:toxin ParE1/3/4
MSPYRLTPLARLDLEDIWRFSMARWGRDQANRYLAEIDAGLAKVALEPWIRRSCDDVRPGYHRLIIGAHVAFYRMNADQVDVVRILHGAMDVDCRL